MVDAIRLFVGTILRLTRTRRRLLLENLVLRQQLAVLKRKHARPGLAALDKLFWVLVRRFWSEWKQALIIVGPETLYVGIDSSCLIIRTGTPANGFDLPAGLRCNSALGSPPTFRVHVLWSSSSALRLAPVGRTIFHSDEALARHRIEQALIAGHIYLLQALDTLNDFFKLGFDSRLKEAFTAFENAYRRNAA
jgi:hypothetical protein